MTDDAQVKSVSRWCATSALVSALVGASLLLPASASTSSDPYLSDHIPVADGCIVLGRAWAGVKVYLVQRRLGTTYERDRYEQGTYDAVKRFQRHHDLRTTGRVNRHTWTALGIDRKFCMDRFTVQPSFSSKPSPDQRIEAMIRWARQQVGRRYIWGGAGPVGYDCSGLALQAMYSAGRVIPSVTTKLHQRQDFGTATAIYKSGLRRKPLAERKRGDLVFYGPTGSMTHMAIYLGHGRILEAVRPKVQKASLWSHDVPLKPKVVRPFGH